MDPFTIGGLVLGAGGLAGSLLSKPKSVAVPDISAELARIQALYEQARQNAVANIKYEAGQTRAQAASNLASRGIYRAPVSENVFGKLRESTGRDIATTEANIGVQSADAQSRMLQALLGAQQQASQYNAQQQAQRLSSIYGGLGSLGSALFSYGMNKPGQTDGQGSYTRMQPDTAWQGFGLGYGAPSQNLVPPPQFGPMQPSPTAMQFASLFRR
jgi:hypothetical protein